ncbi:MAG: hypothetical protein H6747_08955 [Deltaproteobacteria bacterium]|nr:hypothetical protein [Deltaproteobacteria bacterium]
MRTWPADACPPVAARYGTWRLAANGSSSTPVEISHNRWRLSVQYASTVSAGDVTAFTGVAPGDGGGGMVRAKAGAVAYAADGGQLEGQWAPGVEREFSISLAGYAGAGDVTVQLETWSDLPWR